ncbi:MAG: hypothetical protein J6036_00975 [Clostridia bacterium]|nr:hypothetical protein [Clostridia bacterium]
MNGEKSKNIKNNGIITVVFFVISALSLLYFAAGYSVFSVLGILACVLFSITYSILMSRGNIPVIAAIPIVAFAAVFFASGKNPDEKDVFGAAVNVLVCLLLALCLFYCAKEKMSKSKTYASLSAVCAAGIIANALVLVWKAYGNIAPSTVKTAVETAASFIGSLYRNMFEVISESTPQVSEETANYAEALAKAGEYAVKANAISSLVVYGMIIAALSVALYGFFCKISSMQKECLEDRDWIFSMSPLGARFLYVSYAAYFIFDFFVGNEIVSAAFYNVSTVLSVPFSYLGLKAVYNFLKVKINGAAAVIIIVSAILALSLFASFGTVFIILSFIGASSVIRKSYTFQNRL